jgi:hypothetical protein
MYGTVKTWALYVPYDLYGRTSLWYVPHTRDLTTSLPKLSSSSIILSLVELATKNF